MPLLAPLIRRVVCRLQSKTVTQRTYDSGWPPVGDSHEGVRLHLGSALVHLPGYINVDLNPSALPDVCGDFKGVVGAFRNECVDEVLMIHSLGYLTLWEARQLLLEIYRLLRPGGRLVIELPDVAKCAQRLIDCEGEFDGYLEAMRAFYAFGQDELNEQRSYCPYKFGWSSWHLQQELRRVGFCTVTVGDPLTHGQLRWRDIRVEAIR